MCIIFADGGPSKKAKNDATALPVGMPAMGVPPIGMPPMMPGMPMMPYPGYPVPVPGFPPVPGFSPGPLMPGTDSDLG